MRTLRFAAFAVSLALIGAACGGDDDDSSAGDTTTTSAAGSTSTTAAATTTTAPPDVCTADKKGGEITMGVGSLMAAGLDPTVMLGTGVAGATENAAIFDTLMRYNPETGKVEPHVAASLEGNSDSTQWTLKLKPNIKFGNGDPLTADAVKFSVERLAKSTVAASGMAQEVSTIAVVDPLTVQFTIRQSWGGFPYFMASEGGMVVNPAVVAAKGADFAKNPLGGGVGPYEPQSFEPNVKIVLKAKSDYWGGPVCVDTLTFIQVAGGRGTYEAFQKGEMDVMFVSEPDVLADIHAAKVQGSSSFSASGGTLLLNSGRGPNPVLADLKLRQAIHYATDTKLLINRVFAGKGRANTGLTDPDMKIYTGMEGLPYDPAKAKQLVTEAKAAGFDGNITFTCGNTPAGTEESVTMKGLLDAVGFNTNVELLASAAANQKILLEGNYQIGCGGVTVFEEGPFRGMNQFLSTSTRNRVGYKNPEMDVAIGKIYQAKNTEETKAAMAAAQKVWNETVPAVSLWSSEWFVGHSDKVHGLVMSREGEVMWHKAYVEK